MMRRRRTTPIIPADWEKEYHDSDWDGIPNQLDESPMGVPIRRGYEGIEYHPGFYRGYWYSGEPPRFYRRDFW